ncbi:MAG: tungsten formylmethanofuran dehydrogenase [Bacteroidetes bacterium]|nr:tungsten formylmethanofuran dehydrogenase [Bacteroidota bacterium]
MCYVRYMAATYDDNRSICKYVHSTSRGHEAIQIAAGLQLASHDCAAPYYRDEAMLLAMGWSPYELMLQLLAKADDPFSGGRTYYSHPANRGNNRPLIPHQSSATGMQVIPATGLAQGIKYIETQKLKEYPTPPVTLCSVGDGAMTEGEVSEALQFAVLKQLPIIYLVQDNDWGISVSSDEARAMDAYEYAAGFKGLNRMRVDGSDFILSWNAINSCIQFVRNQRKPILLHAKVPLLGHHTSGVRKEWYRSEEDLRKHAADDPFNKLEHYLIRSGLSKELITKINTEAKDYIDSSFEKAKRAPEPESGSVMNHIFAESPVTDEQGSRTPYHVTEKTVMVDAALHAVDEILRQHPEALFYGQDVGRRLGGVFREAATLAEKHGDERVFNTAIQEAYIIGSTAGLSAVGLKPIVEIQFADYIWPGINQLVTELSKSCYLSRGQFPVQSLIRIPIGAYGGGGPYHSGCIESSVLAVRGIKVCYPSNAADLKGLLKGAFYDPNPVVMFEHKGLYWSKVPGTEEAKTIEPDEDYIIPLGKGRVALHADEEMVDYGESVCIISYGMGIHWSLNAAKYYPGQVEVIDLRTLHPLDESLVLSTVKKHGKCIVLTEEPIENSFAQALAGKISSACFKQLDAPVCIIGSKPVPAIPLNMGLEKEILPNAELVAEHIGKLLRE